MRHAFGLQRIDQAALGLLSGAQDDAVHRQRLRLAIDQHMQSLIIDTLVLHADQELHAASCQFGADGPAGGEPKRFARGGGLALQQRDLSCAVRRCARRCRWHQAAGQVGHTLGIDPPFTQELIDLLLLLRSGHCANRRCSQEHRRIEADTTGADDGHTLTGGFAAREQFVVAHHARMIDAGQLHGTRSHACGHHHMRIAFGLQCFGADPGVEFHLHRSRRQSMTVVAQGFMELLAGNGCSKVQLSADDWRGFVQCHHMAALGGGECARQTRCASAHHRNTLWCCCR